MGSLTLHFDGLCEPRNPGGLACYGWIIRRGDAVIASGRGLAARNSTNNVAEYSALIAGLQGALDHNLIGQGLEVNGDSQLVIRQMTGQYAVNADRIIPLHRRATELAQIVNVDRWQWVPRDQNHEADQLSRIAYAEATRPAVTP